MRKKLLSEAQVRRFQSLASIEPLNEMDSYNRDDEATNEELYEEEEMDMGADEEGGDELGDEAGDDSDVELDEELVEKFMEAAATIQELSDALGGGAADDMDMGGEEPADDMDMGGEEPPAPEAEEGGEEEMLEEALRGISYVPSQKEIVKTVAKRVAKRLQEAKRAEARLNRALGKRR